VLSVIVLYGGVGPFRETFGLLRDLMPNRRAFAGAASGGS
jgi:hypothetical protein